jgi:hypothetical protein
MIAAPKPVTEPTTSAIATTESTAIATPTKAKASKAKAKATIKTNSTNMVTTAYEQGVNSPEAIAAGQAYVAGVAAGMQNVVADGLGNLTRILQGGAMSSGIDADVLDAAIARLTPSDDGETLALSPSSAWDDLL